MKSPERRPALALLVLVVFVVLRGTSPLRAQERFSSPDYRKTTDSLMCQCGGCSATVSNCAMDHCHSAEPIREEVAERLQKGDTPESIIQVFTERYGLAILSAPPTEGFHLAAWIAPFVVLVLGFFVTRHVLRSWTRQAIPSRPGDGAEVVPLTDAQRARIEKELREISS